MDHINKGENKPHPRIKAGIVSIISFFYTLKLFRKGLKKDLEEEDLYQVLPDYKSKTLGDQLEDEWEKQKKSGKNSIMRLLWACYGWEYLLIGMIQLVVKMTVIFLQPYALGKIVRYFSKTENDITRNDAYFFAALLIALLLFNCIYVHNYHLMVTGLGIRMRQGFCSFIYRKALKLSPERLSDISIGKIVTLMTKDVHSFESFVHFANDMWIAMIKTLFMCYLIYNKMGSAAYAGVGFFVIVMPLQIYFGSWAGKLRMKMCKKTDERLQITQETLSAIRIIKMYTWEKFFSDKVTDYRKKEISTMHKIFYLKFIVVIIGTLNSGVAFYLLIMTFIWLGNHLTAEVVYYVKSCFGTLSHTLAVQFPIGVTQTAEVVASVKRIGNVIKALEIQALPQNSDMTLKPKISLRNVSVSFKKNEILKNIDLEIDSGLTLLTGPVGSGKSFLVKTILQDYGISSGNLITHGRISYASQEPWLFPSSLRQNIVFGETFNEARYQQILTICALRYDLDLLEKGDETIIEDRGINLSKGQQARVNLARAVYKDADIYLIDDGLAALDAHVSDFIFTECIQKFLKNKLVVLVTHNTNHIQDVDNVVILSHGKVKSFVKPSEIDTEELIHEIIEEDEIEEKKLDELDEIDDDQSDEKTKLVAETSNKRTVYQEVKKSGKVDVSVYKKYVKFGGGIFALVGVVLMFGATQLVSSYTEKLLAKWVNLEENLSNFTVFNETNSTEYEETMDSRNFILNIYSVLIVSSSALTLMKCFALLSFSRSASIKMHKYMVKNIIDATMHFFDTTFIGNILNRFSKDLNTIDEQIPFVFYQVFRVAFLILGVVSLIATVNPWYLVPTAFVLAILVILRYLFLPTSRSIKRLDASTRSPVVGHLNATLEGLTTIRAFKAENILTNEFDRYQDQYTSATYIFQCIIRAFAYWLDTLCALYVAWIIISFFFDEDQARSGEVGMAITQVFHLSGSLQWGIRQWAEIENQMTSVERVLEYTEVKQENKSGRKLQNWPSKGEIKYEKVSLTYTNSTEKVLRNIDFVISPKEKIGVVGRTGAGKSSIISTLFRLYEVEGTILIDGEDTKTLALDYLRAKISIIPQDPVLFTGTVRNNVDPIGQYSDEEIWHAVDVANLKPLVPSLDFEITENGSNFSVGQRQLLCLARAVIRNNKIIVLDEATANMDHETDALIHETIEKNLSNSTVLTIAHKLQTIMNADRVMVLDKGEIIEFDQPARLLANHDGHFYRMVEKARLLPSEDVKKTN